jgi:hypothetical protein
MYFILRGYIFILSTIVITFSFQHTVTFRGVHGKACRFLCTGPLFFPIFSGTETCL